MTKKKFIRQESKRYSKIGKNRKKLQKWRKPKGRDSKMRLKRKSYSASVSVGYKKPRKTSGKIQDLQPVLVHNLKELSEMGKNFIAIIARVGAKKKLEIIKHAKEKKIKILNVKEVKV
ncbi:MAG: eL32 family ribosomal protein [Nanoarchaeota archaeon]|nr:eL32 family ribosomal protein [Nanoarchaeota archaeon]MBU1051640.1 eL32 family ribosomal protein [Nanoarchaeota archaeon]MBU1988842.1 eL32 family ribosomal protein [Nanoarchaeota archaeon]